MSIKYTFFDTPVLKHILKYFSIYCLKFSGWKVMGALPEKTDKFVIIAAPHTTNWDMPIALMYAFVFGVRMYWMGKASIFKFPFKTLMRWMGGIPIDRTKSNNIVDETIQKFNEHDRFVVTIPPEGTRKKSKTWKTGFYHIAKGAGVPIACAYLDYKKKEGGIGLIIDPADDFDADMKLIKSFYSTVSGKYSDNFSAE